VTVSVLKIRHRRKDSRKVEKLARALALLDLPAGAGRPAPRRAARISLGA
jgi:hypothetical protein